MRRAAPIANAVGGLTLLLVLWEAGVRLFDVAAYALPAPSGVATAFLAEPAFFLRHAAITAGEILLGLLVGGTLGAGTALALAASPRLESAARPLLVASQALPVFALAPLLVVWLGFGVASKIAMASLIIYFPVASAFSDGLSRLDPGLADLARLHGAGRLQTLRLLRVPSALPFLASGLRIAATVAPIGAVVGEWVGAAGGLGFIMLQANARVQTAKVFVALALLALLALLVRALVDFAVRPLLAIAPND